MIFKAFVSYAIGILVGIMSISLYVRGDAIFMPILITVGLFITQHIAKKIKKNMRQKYFEKLI